MDFRETAVKDWGREATRLAAFYLLKELLGEFWLFGPPSPLPHPPPHHHRCGPLFPPTCGLKRDVAGRRRQGAPLVFLMLSRRV